MRRYLSLVRLLAVLVATVSLTAVRVAGEDETRLFILRGTVVGQDGQPVTGGYVALDRDSGGPVRDGRFEFKVERSRVVVGALHSVMYVHANVLVLRSLNLAENQTEATVSLRVGESPAVIGRVVTDDMPEGVPWARVALEGKLAAGREYASSFRVAEDGTFLLDGSAWEGFRIQAQDVTFHLPYERPGPRGKWVEIKSPLPMRVELRPPPDTAICGQVVERWMKPVPHAVVMFTSTGHRTGTTTAADDGRFELTNLEPGRYRIQVWARDLNPAEVVVPVARGQQVRSLTVSLKPASLQGVDGDVVGPDGKTGVPNAKVSFRLILRPPPPPGPIGPEGYAFSWFGPFPEIDYAAVTDDNGHFSISLPRPMPGSFREFSQRWSVTAEAEGYLLHEYQGFQVGQAPEGGLEFQLFRSGTLSGIVRLADGSLPPAGSRAELYDESGWLGRGAGVAKSAIAQVSPETGRFDFGPVLSVEQLLVVHIPDWPNVHARVRVAEGGLLDATLTSPPGVVIKGRVLDAVTGRPVPEASLYAIRREGFLLDDARARTDQQGYYQLPPLEPGDISLYVSAKGMTSREEKIHPESPGVQVVDIRLSLAR